MLKILSSIAATGVVATPTDVSLLATGTGLPSIAKIVNILQKTNGQCTLELQTLETEYKKFTCWANKFDGEFADLQKRAKAQLDQADAEITEMTAKAATAENNIETFTQQIGETEGSIEGAVETQKQEVEADNQQKVSYTETIGGLSSALVVLNGEEPELLSVVSSVKKVLVKNHQHVPRSFEPALALLSGPSYQRQSGQITGILSQMKDEFDKDLKELIEKMAQGKKDSEELIANEKKQLAILNTQKTQEEAHLADYQARQQAATIAKNEAEETLSMTGEELAGIQNKIKTQEDQYHATQVRIGEEQKQLNVAIGIVTGDDFNNAMQQAGVGSGAPQKSFLQIGSERTRKNRIAKAAAALRKTGSSALISMAASMKGKFDFAPILKAIDSLVEQNKATIKSERKFKDQGVSLINDQNAQITDREHEIERQKAAVDQLQTQCDALVIMITDSEADLQKANQTKQTAEDLYSEKVKSLNEEITNDNAAVTHLQKVKNVLVNVFDSGKMTSKSAFVQIRSATADAPETMKVTTTEELDAVDSEESTSDIRRAQQSIEKFEFSARSAPADVPALLQQIINEAETDVKVAQANLQNEQTSHLEDMNTLKATINDLTGINNQARSDSALCNERRDTAQDNHDTETGFLQDDEQNLQVLNGEYGFIIKWQAARAENMQKEIDGLLKGKASLQGATFEDI